MEQFQFFPISRQTIIEIYSWRYPPPYNVYNWLSEDEKERDIEPEDIDYFIASDSTFFEIQNGTGELLGFCSFGSDGRVPGGDYSEEAVDIGIGLRPDLTGIGLGSTLLPFIIELGEKQFQPTHFRVTIAAFNKRSQRLAKKLGFDETGRFKHPKSGDPFLILMRSGNDTLLKKAAE